MTNRACRALRSLLSLPRVPKTMDVPQRAAYRSLKRRYNRLPTNVRHLFLDNVAAIQGTVTAQPS